MSENIQNETITFKGEVIKTYEYGDYMVSIYRVTTDAPIDDFYIVTLDDSFNEFVWGVGSEVDEALENAADAYDRFRLSPDDFDDFNLFRKILEDDGEE